MDGPIPISLWKNAMITVGLSRRIDWVLLALVAFDVFVATVALLFPSLWFRVVHGVPYDDPQGLLRRCGANWAAFAVIQLIALLRWKKAPHWLAVVAGVRLSDIFTDWTYLWFASNVTTVGVVGMFLASPTELFLGSWLLQAYTRVSGSRTGGQG
jgi:hypothetical protein